MRLGAWSQEPLVAPESSVEEGRKDTYTIDEAWDVIGFTWLHAGIVLLCSWSWMAFSLQYMQAPFLVAAVSLSNVGSLWLWLIPDKSDCDSLLLLECPAVFEDLKFGIITGFMPVWPVPPAKSLFVRKSGIWNNYWQLHLGFIVGLVWS